MKIAYLFVVFLLALPGAATAPGAYAPARLRIAPAGQVDLGELGPQEIRTREYTFTNASAAPITLRLLDSAPGVSLAGPALAGPIPAFASARLTLTVDPSGWVGPQARNVRLGTDDPGQGRYFLPCRMRVRPDLTVDGSRRSLGPAAAHESPSCEFRFRRETGQPVWLQLVQPPPAYLECELLAEGPQARLVCTLRPARVPPGMRLGLEYLRVASNAPLQPGFDLYVDWRLHDPVEPVPARLVFQDGQPATLELKLVAAGPPFRVLGARWDGPGFQLGPLPEREAGEQVLTVRRTAAGPARAILELRCSGLERPVTVPVAYLPGQP